MQRKYSIQGKSCLIFCLLINNCFHVWSIVQTDTKKISAVSIFFETMPYRLDESTGYIDYDQVPYHIYFHCNLHTNHGTLSSGMLL